ncbi:hypothetical protein EU537_07015 [Candidatus Thorarchaeota archaeon]|nr:MAG: hypothetical protein EU537_07015 [Candidatus Thorarchaeota archaeon]
MSYAWEPPISRQQSNSSSGLKLIAVIVILLVIIAGGIIVIFNMNPFGTSTETADVRVAVVDSGVNADFTTQNRIVSAKSFISPLYGYDETDTSTSDSNPSQGGQSVPHGTIVASTVIENSPNAVIVNAKVVASDGTATSLALIAAIYWAVEENCSVINLSIGSTPSYGDPMKEAVDYAFSKGVLVVASAGNENSAGVAGTSISSPSVFPNAIAVAALDQNGYPADYSSRGPTAQRYMKPDIAAAGYAETSSATYFGTSFAAPRVAAACAELISYSEANDLLYTPGSIMAALFQGAEPYDAPSFVVGSGILDLDGAKSIIDSATRISDLPQITHIHPETLPLSFEQLFRGDSYEFNLLVYNSDSMEYEITVNSDNESIFSLDPIVRINQSGIVRFAMEVPLDSTEITATVELDSDVSSASLDIHISPDEPDARIAFDISHTTWEMDTVYGQFKELYIELTSNQISVTEIRNSSLNTYDYLSEFDAVFLLDPCVWDVNYTNPSNPSIFSLPYSAQEIEAYEQYYRDGGGVFVTGFSNESTDVDSLNAFLSWSGFSIGYETVVGGGDPAIITNTNSHPVTSGVASFAYSGAAVQFNSSAQSLADYGVHSLIGAMETTGGGRIIVTGTNYFIDNWALTGNYGSSSDDTLSLKIALWLSGIL